MKKRFITLDEKIEQATWSWLRFAKVRMLTMVRRMEYIENVLFDYYDLEKHEYDYEESEGDE